MINILLEGYDIDVPWLCDELKNYIRPTHRIAVVAFSFPRITDFKTIIFKEVT